MHQQGVAEFPYYVGINSLSELATKDDKVVVLNMGVTGDYEHCTVRVRLRLAVAGRWLPARYSIFNIL